MLLKSRNLTSRQRQRNKMSFLPRKHLRSRQKHCLTLRVLLLAFLQWLLLEFEFLLGDGMPWILQQLHKLGIAASVGVVSIMTTVAQCCQDRLLRIWHKQHSRARNHFKGWFLLCTVMLQP